MTTCEKPSSLNRCTTAKLILIVENDVDNRAFLQEAIKLEPHYHALVADDSNHALEVVRQIKPDLFLLAYYLDKMTGIDLYNQLHATDGLEDIPAIILTASLPKHSKEIDDHHLVGMSKPVGLDELLAAITRLLEARNEVKQP